MIFVEAIETEEQLDEVAAALKAARCCTTPSREAVRRFGPALAAAGVRILIHPVTLLLETIRAQRAALSMPTGAQATTQSSRSPDKSSEPTKLAFHTARMARRPSS